MKLFDKPKAITGTMTVEVSPELQELLDKWPKRERTYRHETEGRCYECFLDQVLYGETFYNLTTLEHYPVQDMVRVHAPAPASSGLRSPLRSVMIEGS